MDSYFLKAAYTILPIALDLLVHGGTPNKNLLTHATFLEPMPSETRLPPIPAVFSCDPPASLNNVMQDILHILLPSKPFLHAIQGKLHEEWRKGVRFVIGLYGFVRMPILAEQLDLDPDNIQIPELGRGKRCKTKSTHFSIFYGCS
jgi:hypothetical protein